MSSFDCFLGSKDYEGWQTLCELYCTIWDEDMSVSECRFCNVSFTKARKHHCRQCGGIYCNHCAPLNTMDFQTALNASDDRDEWWVGKKTGRPNPARRKSKLNLLEEEEAEEDKGFYLGKMLGRKKSQETDTKWYPGKYLGKAKKSNESSSTDQPEGGSQQQQQQKEEKDEEDANDANKEEGRLCFGCRYGETPGERVQIKLKDAYYKVREKRMSLEKNPSPYGQAKCYKLQRGSLYGTGKRKAMVRDEGGVAHMAGYFELMNKSDFVCSVKVFQQESEPLREASLPSYTTVLPGGVVQTEYDPAEVSGLCVSIVSLNQVAIFSDGRVGSSGKEGADELEPDTRRPDRSVEVSLSPAHVIANFVEVSVFEIDCGGKNCILKYQGNGVVELRKLSTTTATKSGLHIMKTVLKKDKTGAEETTPSHLDTSTNAEVMRSIYSTLR